MHAVLLAVILQTRTVDNAVRLVMRTQHIAGLSLGIEHAGRVLYERGYGFSDLGSRAPAAARTVYRIGSLSKAFTAAAVLQLAQQGKLSLEDPIGRYIDAARSTPISTSPISVEELLSHRSGIVSYTDLTTLDRYRSYAPQDLAAAAVARPLEFEPGTQFGYSNTNYVLLGMLIERVSGMPYADYLKTHIVAPLDLRDTVYGDQAHEARGYARDTLNLPVRQTSTTYAYAAAGISSNVPDLLRFLATIGTPYYGLFQTTMYGYAVLYASGNVNGYSGFELIDVQTGDEIVILTNADALDLAPLAMDVFAALEPPKPGTRAPSSL